MGFTSYRWYILIPVNECSSSRLGVSRVSLLQKDGTIPPILKMHQFHLPRYFFGSFLINYLDRMLQLAAEIMVLKSLTHSYIT